MSKGFLRRCLLIGAIIGGIAVVPSLAILAVVGYYTMVPRYSAVAYFDNLGVNLRLDFYLTQDGALDSGRYLSAINSSSYQTIMVPGWDWSHRARTSVYRIDDGNLAVLSPLGNDYKITLKPLRFSPLESDSGDQWQYLGAFDFAFPPGGRPFLQFYDSQLAECIPMGADDPTNWARKARPHARQATCPAP
jgi:hypothetical protein